MNKPRRLVNATVLCGLLVCQAFLPAVRAQRRSSPGEGLPACRADTYTVHRSLPKMQYACPADLSDSDDQLLKLPERRAAISRVLAELNTFDDPGWWQADVNALNVCDLRGGAGALSAAEAEKLHSGDYLFQLFGNRQQRLVLIPDPCYQTGYNGSLLFLLNRHDGQIVVSQLIDGYYSRVDNSVSVAFARLGREQIIQLETANSMPPGLHYYYFRIDPRTGKAIPKDLFQDRGKPTNEVYSALLFDQPVDRGLRGTPRELAVIRGGRLAPSFSAYQENERGTIDDNGRTLRRIVYRWNGRFYEAVK